jgi:hypothetical protein
MSDWDKFEEQTASSGLLKLIDEFNETKATFDDSKDRLSTLRFWRAKQKDRREHCYD